MFLPTMTDAEIKQEARKDFFELSTKVKIALQRFSKLHVDLVNYSGIKHNDAPFSLLSQSVENLQWPTRRRNLWRTHFRFNNKLNKELFIEYYLYTQIHREVGNEYIFLNSLNQPIAERFTKHFIDRYKERHLIPHGIDVGATPIPLYFQIQNKDSFVGNYYKPSAIGITEGKNKRFWIAQEGIYVTDYIEGMLTYITFMDKDDLSSLKEQVYEEEIVWRQVKILTSDKTNDTERSHAAYELAYNPKMGAILERFAKRNIADDENGEKQKLLRVVREQMKVQAQLIEKTKEEVKRLEKEALRRNRVSGSLDTTPFVKDSIDIKPYHLPPGVEPIEKPKKTS